MRLEDKLPEHVFRLIETLIMELEDESKKSPLRKPECFTECTMFKERK